MSVFENVERIRDAKGVSKTFMAGIVGLSLQGYRNLAVGRLDVERLKKFAAALGEEPAVFFDDGLTKSVIDRISRLKKTGT